MHRFPLYPLTGVFLLTVTKEDIIMMRGLAQRAMTMLIDFVINHDGKSIYLDTKGFATEGAKIKYKILQSS